MSQRQFQATNFPAWAALLFVVIGAAGAYSMGMKLWHVVVLLFETASAEGVVQLFRGYGYISAAIAVFGLVLCLLVLLGGIAVLWSKYRAKWRSLRQQ